MSTQIRPSLLWAIQWQLGFLREKPTFWKWPISPRWPLTPSPRGCCPLPLWSYHTVLPLLLCPWHFQARPTWGLCSAVPSAGLGLPLPSPPSGSCMLCSLTSFKVLLSCHPLSENFPDHPWHFLPSYLLCVPPQTCHLLIDHVAPYLFHFHLSHPLLVKP